MIPLNSSLFKATCPACKRKLALNGTMLPGALVVCVSCSSHLRIESINPTNLSAVEAALSRTENNRPEAYG